ncbi:MAG: tetratricopeptide repeat protein, partial [Armatimonadota bacterium]|nr:tetratricopeptide repeat protein [Armatimonadota bacterium]
EALNASAIERKVVEWFVRARAVDQAPAGAPKPPGSRSSEEASPRPPQAREMVAVRPSAPQRLQASRPSPVRRPATAASPRPTPAPLSPQQYLRRLMREGYELYQGGWYGPALARYREAARVSPESATVQLWYGRAALKVGRIDEARAALERAIALAPASDAAREARVLLEGPREGTR